MLYSSLHGPLVAADADPSAPTSLRAPDAKKAAQKLSHRTIAAMLMTACQQKPRPSNVLDEELSLPKSDLKKNSPQGHSQKAFGHRKARHASCRLPGRESYHGPQAISNLRQFQQFGQPWFGGRPGVGIGHGSWYPRGEKTHDSPPYKNDRPDFVKQRAWTSSPNSHSESQRESVGDNPSQLGSNDSKVFMKTVTTTKETRVSYSKNPNTETQAGSHQHRNIPEEGPSPSQSLKHSIEPHPTQIELTLNPSCSGEEECCSRCSENTSSCASVQKPRPPLCTECVSLPSISSRTDKAGSNAPLEEVLGYKFADITLLQKALRCSKYAKRASFDLAILGDSVLTQIIVEEGYHAGITRCTLNPPKASLEEKKNMY